MNRKSKLIVVLGSLCALAAVMNACGNDETVNPEEAGTPEIGFDSSLADSTTDARDSQSAADAHDARADVIVDAGPDSDGDAADPDEGKVKVRFINYLLPTTGKNKPTDAGVPPILHLYIDDSPSTSDPVPGAMGPASVTTYENVTVGDAGAITFSARLDPYIPGGFTISADPITVAPGEHYTILAVGQPGQPAPDAPHLLVVKESSPTLASDKVGLHFVIADLDLLQNPKAFFLDGDTTLAASAAWIVDASDAGASDAGASDDIIAAQATKTIAVTTPTPTRAGPTSRVPFTIPSDVLVGGRRYYVLTSGELTRVTDDERAFRLLFVPMGDDSPATWIKRDPLVYFFHASPPSTPSSLDVYSGSNRIATNLNYAQAPAAADLPSSGTTLKFSEPGGNVVLDNQSTGALDLGAIYLSVLSGFTGESGEKKLQTKFWKVVPPIGTLTTPRAMFVNASASAPAVDFGYWSVDSDGSRGSTFTPVMINVAYGSTSINTGTDFPIPSGASKRWGGVQATGDANTSRSSPASAGLTNNWYAAILAGDWDSADPSNYAQVIFFRGFGGISGSTVSFSFPKP